MAGWEEHMLHETSTLIALHIGTENGGIVSGEQVNKAGTRYANDPEIKRHWNAIIQRMRETFNEE